MAYRNFDNMGEIGVIRDMEPRSVPPNAWTNAQNVRFIDGKVCKMEGHEEVFSGTLYAPWFLLPVKKNDDHFWFYASQNDVGITDGANHATASETSGGYSATLDLNWTGATLPGGVAVLNNAVDDPQEWTGSSINDSLSGLSGWPANTSCRVMASINNFLVALDVTENGTRIPELVRWSSRADPGNVPSSWDYTDPTIRAGRSQLGTSGPIVDAKGMRDSLAIYQEQGVWLMTEVGGNLVFTFRRVFDQIGALTRKCVAVWRNKHVVFSFDDLVVHDGTSMQSIADGRVRRNIFNTIDSDNYERSYVSINYENNEIWFCYPETGSTHASIAWVWSWNFDNWTKREIPQAAHIQAGNINDESGDSFNSASGDFDSDDEIFDLSKLGGARVSTLIAGTEDTKLYRADRSASFDGMKFTASVTKEALPLGSDKPWDQNKIKMVQEVIPDINGTEGGVVNMELGKRDSLSDSTEWTGPFPYTIGTTRKLNTRVSARVIDIRFYSDTAIDWELTGFRVEYRLSGQR